MLRTMLTVVVGVLALAVIAATIGVVLALLIEAAN